LKFQVPNFQLFIANNQAWGECFSPHGCLSCGGCIVAIVISPTWEEWEWQGEEFPIVVVFIGTSVGGSIRRKTKRRRKKSKN